MNATGICAVYDWDYDRKHLEVHYPKFNPNQIICGQSFLWNPICHYHGCDLRPDRRYYDSVPPNEGLVVFMDRKEFLQSKDKRTNPYNPQCFRCGKIWGMCAD